MIPQRLNRIKIKKYISILILTSLIGISCNLKIANKENFIHKESGLLFATNQEDYIFVPSEVKNVINFDEEGFSITNRYNKYVRQALMEMYFEKMPLFVIEKRNFVKHPIGSQALSSILLQSDTIKVFNVNIEYKQYEKNIKYPDTLPVSESFSFLDSKNEKNITYRTDKNIFIYSVNN